MKNWCVFGSLASQNVPHAASKPHPCGSAKRSAPFHAPSYKPKKDTRSSLCHNSVFTAPAACRSFRAPCRCSGGRRQGRSFDANVTSDLNAACSRFRLRLGHGKRRALTEVNFSQQESIFSHFKGNSILAVKGKSG